MQNRHLLVSYAIVSLYRKAHTKAAQEWLDRLAQENVYVLVCLTYADKLYAELMGKDGSHPKQDTAKSELIKQTEVSYCNSCINSASNTKCDPV